MKIVPIKNTVICEKVEDVNEIKTSILISRKNTIPTYRIVDFSSDEDDDFIFGTGDVVIVEGNGDNVELEGKDYYMFKTKNVIAKIY